ncbi:PucR family transcriptional regulator [Mammaliicoccus stepanovicii]|uniref:Sugar diacid utilization regulator SdaR n=1 Tax=Mammaliicoccus stepanovicii TaxID=643214 RepID=A0A239Y7J8_9STAP|nr:PucR family transcriptional regulator [Mammaliicoccus stepanovicii]PNZ77055.1 PucR family transcriptional regulator [Mammaliicoccus stepanovicii]GGI43006.1 purine catabolism regulatory protein [Mammaliicoccus stepanovicii]SNV55221.1 sugar diacid utilization regulator SdaR [Mammaliicoccus stepanovicii]
MTSLKEILEVPRFSNILLLNKNGDLNRKVEGLDITENQDIKNFTSSSIFILTTAMNYTEDQSKLKILIQELNDINIAGLGIKVSRYLKSIDQDVLDYADSLQFPIFEIPESWNLGELTHQISSFISDDESEKMSYALNLQQELNQMLIKGYDEKLIVERFSKLLKVPIMLINPFDNVETVSYHYRQDKALLNKNLNYFKRYKSTKDITQNNESSFNEQHVIFEVPAFNYFPYYLMVSNVDTLSYPFSLLTIEQAVTTISFAIYKNSRIKIAQRQDNNQFFESLMSENTLSIKQHPDLFKRYNIHLSDFYQVIICAIDKQDGIENSVYLNERYQMTTTWLTNMLHDIDQSITVFALPSNYRFAILLQTRHQYYLDYCKYIQKEYTKFFEGNISLGVGNAVSEFSQLPSSFYEANEAYETEVDKGNKAFLNVYKSKNIQELLQLIPESKLKPFITYTLGTLAYPKKTKEKELKQTLKVYMDNQCDITKTADEIFIHRNTVKYRIKKCEEIIGHSVEDPIRSLDIRIALYASEKISFN